MDSRIMRSSSQEGLLKKKDYDEHYKQTRDSSNRVNDSSKIEQGFKKKATSKTYG